MSMMASMSAQVTLDSFAPVAAYCWQALMSSGVRCEYIWMQPVSDLGFAPVTVDLQGGGEFSVFQCGRPRLMDRGG